MKYIYKLHIGTFCIARFGFGQQTFIEHVISTSANTALSVHAADVVLRRGRTADRCRVF